MNAARLRVFLVSGACALALLVTGCASSAQNSGGKSGKKTTLVCRTEKPTGSHISQRVCHEQHQVDDRRHSDQDKVREIQQRDALNPTNPTRQ